MAVKKTKIKKAAPKKKTAKAIKKRTKTSKVRSSVSKKKVAKKAVKKVAKKKVVPKKKKAVKKTVKKVAKKKIVRKKKTVKAVADAEFKTTSIVPSIGIKASAPKDHKEIPIRVGQAQKSPYVVDIYFEDENAPRLEELERISPDASLGVNETLGAMQRAEKQSLFVADHEIDMDEIMDDFRDERSSASSELAMFGVAEIFGIFLCKIERGLVWPFSFLRPVATTFRESVVETPLERLTSPIIFDPPRGWARTLVSLAGLAFLFILPFQGWTYYKNLKDDKAIIEGHGMAAVEHLKSVEGGEDLTGALFALSQANESFKLAGEELSQINGLVLEMASLIPEAGKKVQTAEALIVLGDNLTGAATLLAKGAHGLLESEDTNLVTKIDVMISYVKQAKPLILEAEAQAQNIDINSLPKEYQNSFELVFENLAFINDSLDDFLALGETMELFLGKDMKQRYLFVFENNTEIRPTGGFMGSFALIDIDRGEITNIEVPGGGTYDMQGSLDQDVIAPEPLRLIADRWEFQDSNWFSDFPTSAEKMIWFYEHSGGPTPDGVIVITATVMERLLEIYGPIAMPEYGREFTAENFIEETQKIVELEYDKVENKPKKVIGDMAPILLDRMLNANRDQFIKTINVLGEMLRQKHVLLYHRNIEIQNELMKQGWTGEIKSNSEDYLMVVNANIAGAKTDGVISQDVDLKTEISEDGEAINTLTITRTHNGIKNEGFSGVNNVNYLRVYVPRGAELINASGFNPPDQELFDEPREGAIVDIDLAETEGSWSFHNSGAKINNEFGKTVFGGWTQTMPGQKTITVFKYRLPFKLKTTNADNFVATVKEKLGFPVTQTYSLFWQKQPGMKDINFSHNIIYPARFEALWSNVPELLRGTWTQTLNTDAFVALLLEKKF